MKNNIVSAACTPAGLRQELLAAQSWALLSTRGLEDGAAPETQPRWAGGPPGAPCAGVLVPPAATARLPPRAALPSQPGCGEANPASATRPGRVLLQSQG